MRSTIDPRRPQQKPRVYVRSAWADRLRRMIGVNPRDADYYRAEVGSHLRLAAMHFYEIRAFAAVRGFRRIA